MNLPDEDQVDPSADLPAIRELDDWAGGQRQPAPTPTSAQTMPPISRPYRVGYPVTYGPGDQVHSVGKVNDNGERLD